MKSNNFKAFSLLTLFFGLLGPSSLSFAFNFPGSCIVAPYYNEYGLVPKERTWINCFHCVYRKNITAFTIGI